MIPAIETKATAAKQRWSREDGIEFSRVVAFSDGVFAIAITLLVLSLHIPEDLHGESVASAIWGQNGDLLAYALSFAVIGRLWLVHHRFFSEITHFDSTLMALNLLYLGFVVLIPFPTEVLGDHGDTRAGVILYAADLSLTNLIGGAMYLYAARAGLARDRFVRYVSKPLRLRNIAGGIIFALSIPIAFIHPYAAIAMWCTLPFVRSQHGH
jgi:TMEM175 potassium channel family protein